VRFGLHQMAIELEASPDDTRVVAIMGGTAVI
jgi:hypothetical protein